MSDSLRSSNGVLLVEDDTARLTICSTLNNRLALPVTIAQTVDEAVDSMRKEGPFAIVIIDIMMTPGHFTGEKPVSPLEAGYRLAEKIRDGSIDGSKTAAAVPIIFVTGVSSQSMVEKCKTIFKPENVFTKPLPPEKIVTRIRQILDKKCLEWGIHFTLVATIGCVSIVVNKGFSIFAFAFDSFGLFSLAM